MTTAAHVPNHDSGWRFTALTSRDNILLKKQQQQEYRLFIIKYLFLVIIHIMREKIVMFFYLFNLILFL